MKEIKMENIRKVEIEHECYRYSTKTVCKLENYINTINYLVSKNIKIISIKFYE